MTRPGLIHAALCTALIAATSAACEPGDDGLDPPPPGDGAILVGSAAQGGVGFVPVDDGTVVELVSGAQGGFHVWLNLRVRGAAGDLFVEREARRVDDEVLVYRGLRQRIIVPDEAMDDWWDSPTAAPAFMCPSPIGVKVFDEALRFEIRLIGDDDEILARDSVVMIPVCPDGELLAFCERICAG